MLLSLLNNPKLIATKHLESTDKVFYCSEMISILQTAQLFGSVVEEINKAIFDYSRRNYTKCLTLDTEFTFALYARSLGRMYFDTEKLTNAMLFAVESDEELCKRIRQLNKEREIPYLSKEISTHGMTFFSQDNAVKPIQVIDLEEYPAAYHS